MAYRILNMMLEDQGSSVRQCSDFPMLRLALISQVVYKVAGAMAMTRIDYTLLVIDQNKHGQPAATLIGFVAQRRNEKLLQRPVKSVLIHSRSSTP